MRIAMCTGDTYCCILSSSSSPYLHAVYCTSKWTLTWVDDKSPLSLSCTILISTCSPTSYLTSTDDIHVILGRPLFVVPSTLVFNAMLAILFLSIRSTWPSHWCCLSCTFCMIVCIWLRAFLIFLSKMWTPSSFLSAAISNASSCFSSTLLL